jgi:hypothetical protein
MKKYIFLLGTVFFIYSCFNGSQYCEIKDVTKSEVVILKKEKKQKYIHAITISGKGQISGSAKIILILNGTPYKSEDISGKVSFNWGGDWYSDTAEIRYDTLSVSEGQLSIKFKFHD